MRSARPVPQKNEKTQPADSSENEHPIRRKTNARAAMLAGVNYFVFDPVVN